MPSSGFDHLCIKCNKSGGNLLVCNGFDCPIVVHDKCMGDHAMSNVVGIFYCPYCLCRNAYAELNQARDDAVLKKKALSAFIDAAKIVDDCPKQKEVSGNANRKGKSPLGENTTRQLDGDKEEASLQGEICRKAGIMFHKEVEGNQENENLSASPSVQEKLSERGTDDLKSAEENECRGNNCDKTACGNENNSISDIGLGADGEGETSNKLSKEHNRVLGKRIKVGSPCEPPSSNVECSVRPSPIMHRSTRMTEKTISPNNINSPCEPLFSNVDCSGKSSPVIRKSPRKTKQTNSTIKVSQKISFPNGRRRRLLWTEEEEEMIKKGVEKFAYEDDKIVPWRTILEFGRGTFHSSRMPGDLKDKWRNMLAKKNLSK